jgi:hypothetical protein
MNRKEVAILSIITLVTVIFWILFGVIHAKNASVVTTSQTKEVIPLTPKFDNDIIKSLEAREE